MPSQQPETVHFPNASQRFILCVAAIVLPPLPVFLLSAPHYTVFTKDFLICLLLTCFGHFPGAIFALHFVLVLFPSRYRHSHSDYVSLPTDDEASEHPNESERSRLGISRVSPPEQQQAPVLGPPKYEDIVTDLKAASDAKATDNKVQH